MGSSLFVVAGDCGVGINGVLFDFPVRLLRQCHGTLLITISWNITEPLWLHIQVASMWNSILFIISVVLDLDYTFRTPAELFSVSLHLHNSFHPSSAIGRLFKVSYSRIAF